MPAPAASHPQAGRRDERHPVEPRVAPRPAELELREGARQPEWLALGAASRLLGVGPDTLRRWADEGRIRAFTTPGGHRRFDRREVAKLAQARSAIPRSLSSLGATPARLARAHARSYRTTRGPAGRDRFDPETRAAFRTEGRRLVVSLLVYLDSTDAAVRARAEADAMALMESTARRLAAVDAEAPEVVSTYLNARRPFLAEIADLGRRRALDGPALTALYDQAAALLDRLLLHLVAAHAALRLER